MSLAWSYCAFYLFRGGQNYTMNDGKIRWKSERKRQEKHCGAVLYVAVYVSDGFVC